jgi:glycolate oxidase FAD binding subunit
MSTGDRTAELVAGVRDAAARRAALRLVGGDSKAFMGRCSEGEALSTAGHSGIVEYEPTELVVSARSGTPLAELKATLREQGQCLGCEPPEFGGATIGGTVACNQSGPARPWLGSVRDHLLGVRLVNGSGEPLHFGGRVMKNVAGYDVARLQAGAMGTLGLITEVTLRVFPRPECSATTVLDLDAPSALQVMQEEAGAGGPLNGACWVDGRLYLRFAGLEIAVRERQQRRGGEPLRDDAGFWRDLREQRLAFFQGDAPLWRVSGRTAAGQLAGAGWLLDWAGGQRWTRGDRDRSALERVAVDMGGQVSLFRGGDRSGEVLQARTRAQKRLHRALKKAFDPHGLFNPGRLYSWM